MLTATLVLALVLGGAGGGSEGTRYTFYRNMSQGEERGGGRRLFGGRSASAGEWGAACALLDRYWSTRCSGAVLAPRWALTAAHCVSPHLAYVKYNTRRPAARAHGDAQPVLNLYRHPEYKVVQEDRGQGMDVTLLHHDIGLVSTRGDMALAHPPAVPPLRALQRYDALHLRDQVMVLGFGRTEGSVQGEELFSARMELATCGRGGWRHCVCGEGGAAGPAGVCAGDSGGPVLYRGAQVGVTSMGPVECARRGAQQGTSVFTALAPYAALLNNTIRAREGRMTRVPRGAAPSAPHPAAAPSLLLAALMLRSADASLSLCCFTLVCT